MPRILQSKTGVFVVFLVLLGLAVMGGGQVQAGQVEKVAGQADTQAQNGSSEVDRLLEILKDDHKREELIQRLESGSSAKVSAEGYKNQNGETLSEIVWNDFSRTSHDALSTLEHTFTSPPALFTLLKRISLSLVLILAAYVLWRTAKRKLLPRVRSEWPIKSFAAVVLVLFFSLGLFYIWGMDFRALLAREAVQSVIKSGITIVFVLIGSYIAWETVNHILYRHIASLSLGGDWDKRLKTLLPLVRSALFVVLSVITLLVVLSELGINIAPLLAGAGIVGLAVGFGAQTLVKDVLTGFFVLLENTINVGDWVILGGHDGQVEGLTIRHVTVRDIYGNLHTVPWSSVITITNQTRKFGYAVVEVGVAYRENIDEVVEVVKEVAEEMRRDPAINMDILSELQILGLIELGDSAVVVRTRFQTTPFMRWRLERDFRRRIKNRFDELGIEIPFPHQTVYFGENKQGRASPARVEIHKKMDSGDSGD